MVTNGSVCFLFLFFLVSCSIKLSGIVLFYIIRGPTTLVCTKKNCFVTLKHHALCTPDMSRQLYGAMTSGK